MLHAFVQDIVRDGIAPSFHDHNRESYVHTGVHFAAFDGLLDHHCQRLGGLIAIVSKTRSIIETFAEQDAPGGLDHARVGKTKFHTCLQHPAEVMEGVHVVGGWMDVLEEFQFLLLDHIKHVHEDILLVLKVLVETALCNTTVFDNTIRRRVLQTIFSKFLHSGIDDRFAFFFGEVKKSLFRH